MSILQFVTILPNVFLMHCNCVHVETLKTSEKRAAVVQTTAHQGICRQNYSLIRQVLSDLPEITQLNEAGLTNITVITKGAKIYQISYQEGKNLISLAEHEIQI